ncbi:Serine/threonine-protein kinase/endoribonuclease IRE1, partial [Orchesella cincta]
LTSILKPLIRTTMKMNSQNTNAAGILSDNDVTDLEEHSNHPTKKASQFYSLIVKRVKGYTMLMKALNDTNQSGAYSILSKPIPLKHNYFFQYYENKQLGKGKFATVVKGKYGHRDVAVKRLFCADESETLRIDTEIEILKRCGDDHENIVQYFADERSAYFVLIIIELCDMTLKTWVEVDGKKPIQITQWDILNQITCGLQWLHDNRVLHQGLKPENTLLKTHSKKIKISGFGSSGLMKEGEIACAVSTDNVAETIGWDAPEVTQAQNATDDTSKLVSFPSDVYSLGCMFYYVLTDGRHDFGDLKNLEIMENTLENSGVNEILLIKQMISDSTELRTFLF